MLLNAQKPAEIWTNAVAVNAWYAKDGTLVHCLCFPYRFGATGRFSDYRDSFRFENAYFPLQNPFDIGGIVWDVVCLQMTVIQMSYEAWNRSLKLPPL